MENIFFSVRRCFADLSYPLTKSAYFVPGLVRRKQREQRKINGPAREADVPKGGILSFFRASQLPNAGLGPVSDFPLPVLFRGWRWFGWGVTGRGGYFLGGDGYAMERAKAPSGFSSGLNSFATWMDWPMISSAVALSRLTSPFTAVISSRVRLGVNF